MNSENEEKYVYLFYCNRCQNVMTRCTSSGYATFILYIDNEGEEVYKLDDMSGEMVRCISCYDEGELEEELISIILSDFKKLNKEFKVQLRHGMSLAQFVEACNERNIKTSPSIAELTTKLLKEE